MAWTERLLWFTILVVGAAVSVKVVWHQRDVIQSQQTAIESKDLILRAIMAKTVIADMETALQEALRGERRKPIVGKGKEVEQ